MKGLELRTCKRLERDVTFIGFGGLEIGRNWGMGRDKMRPDEASVKNVLNTVLDIGINLIDTASAYHKSEERIGKFLSGRRPNLFWQANAANTAKNPGHIMIFPIRQ